MVLLWGLAGWAVNAPHQKALIAHAPEAAPVALSLGGSANYAGIALGGALGGLVLKSGGPAALGFTGAALAASAVVLLLTVASGVPAPRGASHGQRAISRS